MCIKKYITIICSSIILLYGCSFLVKPVAGNFKGDPLDIADEISPQAKQLIRNAFSGFASDEVIDSHTHIVGLGAGDTGVWVNPLMQEGSHWMKRLKFAVYKSASGVQHEDNADQEYIERLVKLIDGMHPFNMKLFILALDKHYNKAGEEDLSHTTFYVPNEYIVSLAQQYPQYFVPVVSIHPYRKDALQALDKWHEQGVKYIKWLPNAQGMDPSDKDIIPFYKKMAVNNMVLITHTGEEKAVEGDEFQRLGNPQLLRLPLENGVTVIMAHIATLGECDDLESTEEVDTKRKVSCFQLALRMLEDKRYDKSLFADISAITQYNRTDKLEEILDDQSLHDRLINGSDYPLPAINILYKTSQLEYMGFISETEKEQLNEIYSYNPILFDFVLKRTIKSPGSGNKLSKEAFILPDNL